MAGRASDSGALPAIPWKATRPTAVDPLDWGPRASRNASFRPHVPAATTNASILASLRIHGDGAHRAVAGQEASFLIVRRSHSRPPGTEAGGIFYVRLVGPALLTAGVHQLQPDIWSVNYTAPEPSSQSGRVFTD